MDPIVISIDHDAFTTLCVIIVPMFLFGLALALTAAYRWGYQSGRVDEMQFRYGPKKRLPAHDPDRLERQQSP